MNKQTIILFLCLTFISCQWYGPGDVSDPAVEESFCQNWNYLYDENQSPYGHSKCLTSCQCDGHRFCYEGCCTGWPRVASEVGMPGGNECLTPTYGADEGIKNHQCSSNCDCGGNRFCTSAGWCHGTAKYGEVCLNQNFESAQEQIQSLELANQTDEQWQEEQCGCENLFSYAWQLVFGEIQASDSKLQVCTKLINMGQEKAANTVCSGQKLCSYIVKEATDVVTEYTVEEPMREICVQMLTVIEDFSGVEVSSLIQKGKDASTDIILEGAKLVCGQLSCANSQDSSKCQSTEQNGASFTQATVNGLCDLKEFVDENINQNQIILHFSLGLLLILGIFI